jgi:hypothetical protein
MKIANGGSCTGNNQCSSGVCGSYHRDADGDSYGASAVSRFCGSSPPSGYVVDGTDCCDADGDVHPNQGRYFPMAANAACGASYYDYDCVGGPTPRWAGAGSCTTVGACDVMNPRTCSYTAGWSGGQPLCGNGGTYVTGCNLASACTPCPDPGACGRGCASQQTASRTQECK